MSKANPKNSKQLDNSYVLIDDDYDNDDLISFEIESTEICLYYSLLTKYSKKIRDKYLFSDVIKLFPQEIFQYQSKYKISTENILLFFELLQQNYNIKKNTTLTYMQCIDLLKISKYLEIRKLSKIITEYIKDHNIDVDFLIQVIQRENQSLEGIEDFDIGINEDIENYLSSKIDDCFSNEKFCELPISTIYRIVGRSENFKNKSDKVFNFIKKSISKFYFLFSFVNLQELSPQLLEELFELYSKADDKKREYFKCIEISINKMIEINDHNKNLTARLEKTERDKELIDQRLKEREMQMKELKKQIKEIEARLNETELRNKQNEEEKKKIEARLNVTEKIKEEQRIQIKKIQNQLEKSESEKKSLQKVIEDARRIKGEIKAVVRNGLLVSARIKLIANGPSLDTKKSKYIICKCDSKPISNDAYENGYPITKLEMTTHEFLCKSGNYCFRCLVFDSEGRSTAIVSNQITTNGMSVSFSYEGKPSELTLFEGRYKLEVWGAQGGNSAGKKINSKPSAKGGLGGYSQGILNLIKEETVHIFVGGQGQTSNILDGSTTDGGFPDGGGTKTGHFLNYMTVPGTGGGSTSIRIGSGTNYSRVIVAGGGGGACGSSCDTNAGGFGGGQNGGNCYHHNSLKNQGAGTQTGSTGGSGRQSGDVGEFGRGAAGKYQSGEESGGGGGGGWYGGGGGSCGDYGSCSSGGGGSGWIFTESSFMAWMLGDKLNSSKFELNSAYYLSEAVSISGDKIFPSPYGNVNEQGHQGNGYAKITPE